MRAGKWLFLIGIACVIVLFDQIAKAVVVANLNLYETWMPVQALEPVFNFIHIRNTGAAFGIFPDGGLFFTVVAFVVIGVIIHFYRQLPEHSLLIRTALGLQLGGAVGNLIDRLRQGYVVDFFNFKVFPVFNIADSAIVVGVLLLVFLLWQEDRREDQRLHAEAAPSHPAEDESETLRASQDLSGSSD
jgi:signal peptidase II